MVMAATVSMKKPTMNRIRLRMIRTMILLSVNPVIRATKCSVTRLLVSSQAKIEAPATISRMMAVVSMVSMETRIKRRRFSVRYHTSPRNNAQATAAVAASVGVNQPVRMPPTMMTGVISDMIARLKVAQSTFSEKEASRG